MAINDKFTRVPRRTRLGIGAAVFLTLGAAGGAGAVSLTRPDVVMAPTVQTPIAKLSTSSGVVTVKGRVAEVYGNRFVVQDGTGRAMIDAGRGGASVASGQSVMVQGRFDDGQMRAAYLVGPDGKVDPVGPAGPPPHGRGGPGGPGRDGPPPPPPGGPGGNGPGGPGGNGHRAPPPPGGVGCGPADAAPPPAMAAPTTAGTPPATAARG